MQAILSSAMYVRLVTNVEVGVRRRQADAVLFFFLDVETAVPHMGSSCTKGAGRRDSRRIRFSNVRAVDSAEGQCEKQGICARGTR